MEVLTFRLKAGVCHLLDKSHTIVVDGSSFSFKWKLDFNDGMKLKHYTPAPFSQP
jgi:hypothetical protein